VGLKSDTFELQCTTDTTSNEITWSYDSVRITGVGCKPYDAYASSHVTNNSDTNNCDLYILPSTTRQSGPYKCSAGGFNAQAVVIIIGQ